MIYQGLHGCRNHEVDSRTQRFYVTQGSIRFEPGVQDDGGPDVKGRQGLDIKAADVKQRQDVEMNVFVG